MEKLVLASGTLSRSRRIQRANVRRGAGSPAQRLAYPWTKGHDGVAFLAGRSGSCTVKCYRNAQALNAEVTANLCGIFSHTGNTWLSVVRLLLLLVERLQARLSICASSLIAPDACRAFWCFFSRISAHWHHLYCRASAASGALLGQRGNGQNKHTHARIRARAGRPVMA